MAQGCGQGWRRVAARVGAELRLRLAQGCGPGLAQCGQDCREPENCSEMTRSTDTSQAVWMMPLSTVSGDTDQVVSITLKEAFKGLESNLKGSEVRMILMDVRHNKN